MFSGAITGNKITNGDLLNDTDYVLATSYWILGANSTQIIWS